MNVFDNQYRAPTYQEIPDHPIDLDAIEVILRMARSGTFGPAELRMRLRQVVG